jgi:hypothetical protein
VADKNKPISITVRITGVRETLTAFRELPKEASAELRDASGRIAAFMAVSARERGMASSARSALVAGTVRPARDRVPVVQAGGSTRLGSRNVPAWALLFGDEFGAVTYRQFRPHRGNLGYWFFSSIEGNEERIDREWNTAADAIIAKWAGQ